MSQSKEQFRLSVILLRVVALLFIIHYAISLLPWILDFFNSLSEISEADWPMFIHSLPILGLFVLSAVAFKKCSKKTKQSLVIILFVILISFICFTIDTNCHFYQDEYDPLISGFQIPYYNWWWYELCIDKSSRIKYGYIDKTGTFVIAPKFDWAFEFSEGLARVEINNKWGFIDKSGQFVIPLQFDWAYDFSEGLAAIKIEDKWGYIDPNGQVVIETKFDPFVSNFSEGLARIEVNKKYGYINRKGDILIEPKYTIAFDFSEGLACVDQSDARGYIDKKGNFVIKPHFSIARSFSEGLAMAAEFTHAGRVGKFGFIDKQGKYVIAPQFDSVESFHEERACIWDSNLGKKGFINKDGTIVVDPLYDAVLDYSKNKLTLVRNDNGKKGYRNYYYIYLMDHSGNIITTLKGDSVGGFSEGLSPIHIKENWGFIDEKGNIAIDPQYSLAGSFSEDLACVGVKER